MKVIYNDMYKDIATAIKKKFNCKIEKSKHKDVLEIYIDNQIAYSIKDDFSFSEINFNYIVKKIDKFYKNKKLRNNSNKVGGLGNINLEEY